MRSLEFGIWDHFERRPDISVQRQYQEKIELLKRAEGLGYYAYHLAEHHLTPLDLAPSPNVFLAALAQATRTLRFGSMVYVLPLYHPLRLIQEIAMLDQLSGGRLEIGVGRGIRPIEHGWYGLDSEEARARTDEMLGIIERVFREGRTSFEGRFYRLPDVALDVLPLQRPHPPIWYAGGVEFAGARGLNFLGRGEAQIRRYWDLWSEGGELGAPRAGIMHHMMLARTEGQAMAIARRAWPAYVQHFQATPLAVAKGGTVPGPQDFDAELKRDLRIIGTAARAQDFIGNFLHRVGSLPSFYFAGAFQWGDISCEEALESMQIFAEEVMPIFRTEAIRSVP